MNSRLFTHLFHSIYKSLFFLLTLIFLTSCSGGSSNSSNDNSGSTTDYVLSITAEPKTIEEADGNTVIFTIRLSSTNISGAAISGSLTWEGSANESDFTDSAFPSTFSIAVGESETVIELTVVNDDKKEGSETLVAEINNITTLVQQLLLLITT